MIVQIILIDPHIDEIIEHRFIHYFTIHPIFYFDVACDSSLLKESRMPVEFP